MSNSTHCIFKSFVASRQLFYHPHFKNDIEMNVILFEIYDRRVKYLSWM